MKTPLLHGFGITLVTGVVTLIAHLLGYWSDPQKLMTGMMLGGLCGITVQTIGIVLGTRRARTEHGTPEFSYGDAFKNGVLIAFFAAVFGIVFNFIFFKFLVPDFAETQAEWMRSFMEKMNAPAYKIEEAIEGMRAKATLVVQLRNGFIGTVVIGTVISLISSAFLKRKASDNEPSLIA